MKSYLLLGILLLYYLCMFLLIEGRSAGIKEKSDHSTNMHLLCPTFSNISLQNITRLYRSSLGGRVQTDHLGRSRTHHRRRVPTRRRNKPKLNHSLQQIA
ncbi:uncharacterized protein LOC27208369 [Drosophila simulans]|uniref:uncharacterized protein LOC27208369 n=1 Tax=Drosophila simulans TaxID=7240 RepID=UPI00078AE424|nr:uncharacterized protein LOC27208369 [Drosophila simulans]KMZ06810.1 uncharacterized protein Dsimw501_GD28522 [Drosophila simulans]